MEKDLLKTLAVESATVSSLKEMSKKIDPEVRKRGSKITKGFFEFVWWIINPALLLLEFLVWVLKKVQLVAGTVLSLVVHPILTTAKFRAKAEQIEIKLEFCKFCNAIKRIISYLTISNFKYQIGNAYYFGKGVEKDLNKAFEWYKKAAQKYTPAQYSLGFMYVNGYGTGKNIDEAFKMYEKAAEQGHLTAQYFLAVMYGNGYRTEKNLDKANRLNEAFKWYKKAAKQGLPKAQNNLGYMYDKEKDVEQNLPEEDRLNEAVKWYRKAAERGYKIAQFNLGAMYHGGEGVEKNLTEGIRWWKKSAEQGYSKAQFVLGLVYRLSDNGVPKNYIQSYKWCNLAAANGHPKAPKDLDNAAGKLTPEQLAEAQKLASEWKPTEEEPDKKDKVGFRHLVTVLVTAGIVWYLW